MELQQIKDLMAQDMAAVDDLAKQRLRSEVALINRLGHYIVNSGGKRLRPMLVLLSARACGYSGQLHIDLAAIIEFIHTATLLHDDVVDASELRRGRETANTIWGNESSVLVGDFLYSRAFEMMVTVGDMWIMEILAHATNTIAEGEVLQLLNCHDASTTEARYMDVIQSKTAKLFEAGSRLGGVLAGQSAAVEQALARYGMHLGTAFQLIDDVLDYSASPSALGKNLGADLSEGKPTLPLIHALHQGSREEAAAISRAIESGGDDKEQMRLVMAAIESTHAITYTEQVAKQAADEAIAELDVLPDSDYKRALTELAEFSIHRGY